MSKILKRILALMLVMFLVLSLTACTDDDEEALPCVDGYTCDEPNEIALGEERDEDLISIDELIADLQKRFPRAEQYEFTDPLIGVSRDHMFTFEMTYEAMEVFRTVVAEADNNDGWQNMVRIYRDSALTQRVTFAVGGDEENFSYVTFSPFRNPTFGLRYGGIDLFPQGEFNDWGNASQYFLVRYYDLMTGERLARPLVTVFSVATEIVGAPRINFNVDSDGIAGLRWDAIPGAEEYAVVLITENRNGTGIGRQVDIIARTTETYWDDHSTEAGHNNRNFRTTRTFGGVDTLYENYRGQIISGEMSIEEFVLLASEYNFELEIDLERNIYFAVIAINEEGTSAISNLIDRRIVAQQVPLQLAFHMNEGGIRPLFFDDRSTARLDRDILSVPSHAWVIMADGSASQHLVIYDVERAQEGTQLIGHFVLDDEGEMVLDSTENALAITVPYVIEGTIFTGHAQILRYNVDTFEADLVALAGRQDSLRSRTGDIERSVNLNPTVEASVEEDAEVATELRGDFEIRASSPLSAYLALQMLNSQTRISLADFPEASDHDYLVDAWFEAVLQNPLVLGARGIQLDWLTGDLLVTYDQDAGTQQRQQQAIMARVDEIVAEIITPDMTALDMQLAINNFLIEYATYDFAALENAELNNFLFVDPEYYDSFTAYGILINGVGVCSGYADAFTLIADRAGLESKIVTGFLQGSLPHAWNRVYIDGEWLTLDVTNNDNEFFPNAFFNLSDIEAATILTEDDQWILNSELHRFVGRTSETTEYYRLNNRFFDRVDIVNAMVAGIRANGRAIYRTDVMLTEEQFMMIFMDVALELDNFDLLGGHFLGVIHIFE